MPDAGVRLLQEMGLAPTGAGYLDDIRTKLEGGQRQWKLGYNLLAAFGYVRRRQTAIDLINRELDERGLTTMPAIDPSMPLDGFITFYLKDGPKPRVDTGTASVESDATELLAAEEEALHLSVAGPSELALTVRNLEAAEREPPFVDPSTSISEAMTKLELLECSQLVVKTTPYNVRGVISYRSIARARMHGDVSSVYECIDQTVPQVEATTPLLEVVRLFRTHDAVLVLDKKALRGMVTGADIADEFGGMAEPFLMLGEIEQHLRWLLRNADIGKALAIPEGTAVPSVVDLTIGDMQRALERPDTWAGLGVPYDRATFCSELDAIRQFRNQIMHSRGRLDAHSTQKMRRFAQLLRAMCANLKGPVK